MTAEIMPPPFVKEPRPRRILVIGGGVAGLAALRMLVEEGVASQSSDEHCVPFDRVELIERRGDIGGTWYLDEETLQAEQAYPGGTADHQWPVYAHNKPGSGSFNGGTQTKRPYFPSPAYPALRGNVLPRFLSLAGADPFPTPAGARQPSMVNGSNDHQNDASQTVHSYDPFPTLDETQAYLRHIAEPLRPQIRTNTECLGVWELPDVTRSADGNRWAVRIRDWKADGVERTEYWDAIVSAAGWTDTPLFPRAPGLEEARRKGFVDHCKWYRGAEPYGPGKRVIVIGNGNSGNDCAAQIAARRVEGIHEPVFRAIRHKAPYCFPSLTDSRIRDVPPIRSVDIRTRLADEGTVIDVTLEDGSKIPAVDKIIVAAGYELLRVPHLHLLRCTPHGALAEALPAGEESDWLPQQKLGSGDITSLWHNVADPPNGQPFDPPGVDGTNPARIPDLWMLTLHARAATLGFVNLAQNSIPFTCSDVQAHLIRVAWDGSGADKTLPRSLDERLQWEQERIKEVNATNAERTLAVAKARAAMNGSNGHAAPQEKLAATRMSSNGHHDISASLPLYTPPERTRVRDYHSIGTNVRPFLTTLRDLIVAAKPHWKTRLPDYRHDDAYFAEHDAMYSHKYASLVARRAAQGTAKKRAET